MKTLTIIFFLALISLTACFDDENTSVDTQLDKEVKSIDEYLSKNVTDFVAYDQSGIRIVIHKFGEKPPPRTGQTIKATYTGKLFSSGTVFENGVINSKLEEVVGDGLGYSLSALLNGSTASFYIPSMYAFGSVGTTNVPANSIIVYENVMLTDVIKTPAEQTQFDADTLAIHNFLKTAGITNAIKHSSGICYTIDEAGTGISPNVYGTVSFSYAGSILSTGVAFDQGQLTRNNIFSLIDGFKVGLPLLKKGTRATLYIPSGLGYGVKGSGSSIPPNSNLKFVVTLTDVIQ